MKPVEATIEILASRAMNENIDKRWIDWAVEMLMAGYDTENLAILAGEFEPYNQFELQRLVDKIFIELDIDFSDKDQAIKNYAGYLIDKALDGTMDDFKILGILKDICIELDYEKYLYGFYTLSFAKDDLNDSEHQYYWDGADRGNIDSIIKEYFIDWKAKNIK